MSKKAVSKKIWYVEFPTYQYNEDVLALAKAGGFKIIDARFQGDNKQAEGAPKLTKIGEPKRRAKKTEETSEGAE